MLIEDDRQMYQPMRAEGRYSPQPMRSEDLYSPHPIRSEDRYSPQPIRSEDRYSPKGDIDGSRGDFVNKEGTKVIMEAKMDTEVTSTNAIDDHSDKGTWLTQKQICCCCT